MLKPTEKIWHNGRFIAWDDAKIHVLSHVTSYGSSVFEGVRCYATSTGPAIFRVRDHINNPTEVYIACWEWGKYLGEEALASGVDVCVSSWTRIAPNTLPALAKAGANYMNSQLIRMEAHTNGYAEGIALDTSGYVSEGSGENIFVVRDGKILTPPLGASVLPGITRETVIQLAATLGFTVTETLIPRELLYIADEVFFSGTAAEITPIRSVDRVQVGEGARGRITGKLQKAFFDIVNGHAPDRFGWLLPVGKREPVAV